MSMPRTTIITICQAVKICILDGLMAVENTFAVAFQGKSIHKHLHLGGAEGGVNNHALGYDGGGCQQIDKQVMKSPLPPWILGLNRPHGVR